jgi:hypothetical protein
MGFFRFRRRFPLGRFVHLNIGKGSVSTSVGFPGAHLTFGPHGTRATVSAVGTGLSYTANLSHVTPSTPPVTHVCQLPECSPRAEAVGKVLGVFLILGLAGLLAGGFLLLMLL